VERFGYGRVGSGGSDDRQGRGESGVGVIIPIKVAEVIVVIDVYSGTPPGRYSASQAKKARCDYTKVRRVILNPPHHRRILILASLLTHTQRLMPASGSAWEHSVQKRPKRMGMTMELTL
jgi:hypothetical protein